MPAAASAGRSPSSSPARERGSPAFDRSREAEDELVAALEQAGARSHLFVEGDVRDPAAVERAVQSVVDATGRIDVLVNCAGVREIGDVYTMPAEEWENVIAINLSGTFYCCQSAARQMRDTGGGSIVNLSSVGGLIGLSHRPAYTASKHAIVGLTKSLARDLGPAGIRVNALCPGVIRTPMTEQYFSDDSFEQELAVSVPLGALRRRRRRRQGGAVPRERPVGLPHRGRPAGGRRLPRREELRLRPGRLVVPVRERDARLALRRQNVTGSRVRMRTVGLPSAQSGCSSTRRMPGSRSPIASNTTCASSRASGAPMQKWMPCPKAR